MIETEGLCRLGYRQQELRRHHDFLRERALRAIRSTQIKGDGGSKPSPRSQSARRCSARSRQSGRSSGHGDAWQMGHEGVMARRLR